MKIFIILFYLLMSCTTTPTEQTGEDSEKVNETILYFPRNLNHARTILKHREGKFNDAILILKVRGNKDDIPLIKDFIKAMERDKELYKLANAKTVNKSSYKSMCLKAIEVLNSPNRKELQYELVLHHPETIEEARAVFKEGKGDFFAARHIMKSKGTKMDASLIENFLVRLKKDKSLKERVAELHPNYTTFYQNLIKALKSRD